MPIQEKDLGKYKRPAIYINEIDNSLIELPAQNVLINLVPGFSRRGPFNRPVYVDNTVDFERIYGPIDKQLENKGSYFHRTCTKMLETSPIWALNLLSTVPNRDILNYVSISSSAVYQNSDFDEQRQADYERFFNRQDFWIRDEEAFLNVVDEQGAITDKLLHLTNMGDRTLTTFLFKSDIVGFDMTASSWYGGDTKVPSYIDPKSLMSDYMIGVLIIAGDWTDYKTLSSDSTWSRYFTLDGLIISNIQNFVNERGVTTLGNYDVCLIPNFKDLNNRDMYIKNVINNNTDKTGLFCTYNEDLLLDNDYLSDLVDLIGNTIVGLDVDSINFLSYNQSIKESINYPLISLDSPGNVFGNATFGSETYEWNNWTQTGITFDSFDDTTSGITFTLSSAQYIINGVLHELSQDQLQISNLEVGKSRNDVIYLDSNGIHVMNGIVYNSGSTQQNREITFSNTNSIILGTLLVTNNAGSVTGIYTEITDSQDVVEIATFTGSTGLDTFLGIEFLNTSGGTLRNNQYSRLRSQKVYNEIATALSANKGVIIKSDGSEKTAIKSIAQAGFTSTTNSQIHIYVDSPNDYTTTDTVLVYYIDNMLKLQNGFTTAITTDDLSENNIIGKYSKLYEDFVDGIISTGNYVEESGVKKYITMFITVDGDMTFTVDPDISDVADGITITSEIGNWKQTVEIEKFEGSDMTNIVAIYVDKDRYTEVIRGQYLEAYYDVDYYEGPDGEGYVKGDRVPRKLVRITNVKNDPIDTRLKILYTDGPIKIEDASTDPLVKELYTTTYPAVYRYATHLKGIALKPFVLHQDSIPNGTETRMNNILNVMGNNTSLFKGLINKNKISWRYLIDSFGLGLQENSKQQYLDLCGAKLNCMGFINMPSAKAFKKSSNPSFVNDDGSLSTAYIKDGANQMKNPDFLYSFGDGAGRSTVGYFFPYVRVTADGISSFVPPAAYVATAYMRKFTTSVAGITPWTIVAGVNTGRVPDISGTEMDFSDDDLDNFAEMGANPITFIRNVGYIINDENTAQVFPVSSLSYLHSREVLIELENELYDMLLRYQWKFNTPTIRSEIKYRADRICQRFVDAVGLYAYRNVIDETNNTPYIIDLQGGVLDTYIEIVKGMGWIVNNITIERTGTINSTGFQQ